MIGLLRSYLLNRETLFLSILTTFCVFLSFFRWSYTGSSTFLFLNWNLLLAIVPWAISTLFMLRPKLKENKVLVLVSIIVWLLFFPNAPYILTDLFHIRHRTSMPMWFDLILILSFAWTGLLYGLFSLWHIEKVLQRYFKLKILSWISSFLFFVVGFGIYLGRVLRWNSWDVLSQPKILFSDIVVRFVHPFHYPQTWGMTLLMGLFLNIVYWTFKYMNSSKFQSMYEVSHTQSDD